jgi:hypothetical protein
VYIDGGYYGRTPETVTLSAGYHDLMLEKSGYYDWYQTIYVYGEETQYVHGTLTSRSYPFPYPPYYYEYRPYVVPEFRFEYRYYRYPRYWRDYREREAPRLEPRRPEAPRPQAPRPQTPRPEPQRPREERRDERNLPTKPDQKMPRTQYRGNLIQFDNQPSEPPRNLIEERRSQQQDRLLRKDQSRTEERLRAKSTPAPEGKLENKDQKEQSSPPAPKGRLVK